MAPITARTGSRADQGHHLTMMIIDLRTQIWANLDQLGADAAARVRDRNGNGVEPVDGSEFAHETAMSQVDGAVIMGYRADRLGACIPNEFVAEFVGRDPSRRIGIAGIDPLSGDADDQLDIAIGLGLVGVNLAPANQGFHPTHTAATRLYERCVEAGLPVFVTMQEPLTAAAELEFTRPCGWDEVARGIPELRLVIGQLGFPFVDETLLLIDKHEHIYADISGFAGRRWQLYNALLSATSAGVMSKLLFGSGFPFVTPARAIESIYSVNAYSHGTPLPSISRASINSIIEQDVLGRLGIDSEITSRHRELEESGAPVVEVVGANRGPAIES